MVSEFQITLSDQPGSLARLGHTLGDANVNIEAIHGASLGGESVVHLVTDEPGRAREAIQASGFPYREREVLLVSVLDEPGTLGDVALVMSEAGINIDAVYVTTRGHVVLGVDDLPGAVQVAGGMAVMVSP
jgi:hypothetical protein